LYYLLEQSIEKQAIRDVFAAKGDSEREKVALQKLGKGFHRTARQNRLIANMMYNIGKISGALHRPIDDDDPVQMP
jgi:hypothetical protein